MWNANGTFTKKNVEHMESANDVAQMFSLPKDDEVTEHEKKTRQYDPPIWNDLTLGEQKSIILLLSYAGIQIVDKDHNLYYENKNRSIIRTNSIMTGESLNRECVISWMNPTNAVKDLNFTTFRTTNNDKGHTVLINNNHPSNIGGFEFINKSNRNKKLLLDINGETGNVYVPNNIGIGLKNPVSKLHVDGTISIGNDLDLGNPIMKNNISTKNYLSIGFSPGNQTDNIEKILNITSIGNIGIGTTSPIAKLDIVTNTNEDNKDNGVRFKSGGDQISHSAWGSLNDWYIRSGFTTGRVILQDKGGNVGIGTDIPSAKLDVKGLVYINENNDNRDYGLQLSRSGITGQINGSFEFNGRPNQDSEGIIFKINNTEKIRISKLGNLGIGTNTPTQKLEVNGSIKHKGLVQGSDNRIKENIKDINNSLQKINQFNVKSYQLKETQKKDIGFIAQEVYDILPEAVTIIEDFIPNEMKEITNGIWTKDNNNWKLKINDLNIENNTISRFYVNDNVIDLEVNDNTYTFDQKYDRVFLYGHKVKDFHTLDYNKIFSLHHGAIQELSKKNDEKDKKIEDLQTKCNNLELELANIKKILKLN